MKTIILLSIFGFLLCSCTNEKQARRVLEMQGYSNIKITGYDFIGCSDDDLFHTGFTATKDGKILVKGTVCSGILKNATIRYK